MSAESTENSWIKKYAFGPKDFMWRVENRLFEGTFDTFAIVLGKSMWIEIKAPIEPARPDSLLFASNHKFTQGQKNFGLAIRKAEGTCWGFIGTNLRQMLIPGSLIEEANGMTADELEKEAVWSRRKAALRPLEDGALLRYVLAEREHPPKDWFMR